MKIDNIRDTDKAWVPTTGRGVSPHSVSLDLATGEVDRPFVAVPSVMERLAGTKMNEDTDEVFSIRELREAVAAFTDRPSEPRWRLVNKLVLSAIRSTDSNAELVADFFSRATSKEAPSSQCDCDAVPHPTPNTQVNDVDRPHKKAPGVPPRPGLMLTREGNSKIAIESLHSRNSSMSKSSVASALKNSTQLVPMKPAWSKGPPQVPSSAPSSRSQSPETTQGAPQPTHSRPPSVLGQRVSFKDGVAGARSPTSAIKSGSSVTFGSIDDVAAPISSSASVPPIRSEGLKSFGSVPATPTAAPSNGKSSAGPSSSQPPATPATPSKFDVKKLFQVPSSSPAPSSTQSESSSAAVAPAMPPPPHPPHTTPSPHAHTAGLTGVSSPPPTPSTSSSGSAMNRLKTNASAFVPRRPNPVKITTMTGMKINAETLKRQGVAAPSPTVLSSPAREVTTVLMETPEAKKKRLAEEDKKERHKKEAEEAERQKTQKAKKQREEAERKKAEEERVRKSQPVVQPLPSALATARIIEYLSSVSYPEGIQSPKVELNINVKQGKFRYDRDFLLQFMAVCKEKPESLPPLDAIGLESSDQSFSATLSRGGSGRRSSSVAMPPPSSTASRQAIGLGISGFPQSGSTPFNMGQFATANSETSTEERFAMSNPSRSTSISGGPPGMQSSRAPNATVRSSSQSGLGGHAMANKRTRSRRGVDPADANEHPPDRRSSAATLAPSTTTSHSEYYSGLGILGMRKPGST